MKLYAPTEEEADAAPENSPSGDRTEAQNGAEGIWHKADRYRKGLDNFREEKSICSY